LAGYRKRKRAGTTTHGAGKDGGAKGLARYSMGGEKGEGDGGGRWWGGD